MRLPSNEMVMKRFDKNKLQSMEYLGYDMQKAKAEHFKRITYQRKRWVLIYLFALVMIIWRMIRMYTVSWKSVRETINDISSIT